VATASPGGVATLDISARRNLGAACVGNAVEWYDFAVFGALAALVGAAFFPSDEQSNRLVAAFAVYLTAFVARPLGAVYFGRSGDRGGRRWPLLASLVLMTGATAAIGLLPGYAVLGLLAPVLLVLLRAGQGFAGGGELGVAAVFIVEHAPARRRGAYGAWHTVTLALGMALGFGAGGVLVWLVDSDRVPQGWWRAGFLLALPLGLVGLHLRSRMHETGSFSALGRSAAAAPPLGTMWRLHRRPLVTGFALIAAGALAFNTFFVWLPNWVASTEDVPLSAALGLAVVGLLLGALSGLVCGRLSDLVGRRPVVLTGTCALAALALPLMMVVDRRPLAGLAVADLVVGLLVGGVLSMAAVAEMFPTPVRATGMALTVGLASALVGGTAPLLEQLIAQPTGLFGPGLYVAVVAAAAALAVKAWPETAFDPLP
jgi:MHS family proline/betaine transporter-like MFS transporter